MIMSNFIQYCAEDNEKLANDIKIYLADYFDLPHRTIELTEEEYQWIENNLADKHIKEIFGNLFKKKENNETK